MRGSVETKTHEYYYRPVSRFDVRGDDYDGYATNADSVARRRWAKPRECPHDRHATAGRSRVEETTRRDDLAFSESRGAARR